MLARAFSFWQRLVGGSAAPKRTAQEDRRLWVRHTTDLQGRVRAAGMIGSERLEASIRDLSRGGANLVVSHPFEAGEMLTLELPSQEGETRTILACVVRVAAEDAHWSLGCVFSRELTEADLGAFGAEKKPAAGADQRIWVRYSCDVRATCRKFGEAAQASQHVQVLNISASGIGLVIPPPLDTGSLLNLDLFDKTGRRVCGILACIVHTTQRAGGDYAVGCNFIRELTEEEIESLL